MQRTSFGSLSVENPHHLDMESILTRAVYRVLNNSSPTSGHLNRPNNVEKKSRVHFSPDMNVQMRLIAEQLCKRIERRYDQRLNDQRDQDREHTDRRLQQIRKEYAEQLDQIKRQTERERTVTSDVLKDRERSLQQKFDIQTMDRENNLEIQRKLLENRFTELKLAKDHLEKSGTDFKRKMKTDLETIRLEWERLALKQDHDKDTSADKHTKEVALLRSRLIEAEESLADYTSKDAIHAGNMTQLRQRLEQSEIQLALANSQFQNRTVAVPDESRSLELLQLREENNSLRDNLRITKDDTKRILVNELYSRENELKTANDALQYKVKELKVVIGMMNEKIKVLTSERTYLREELRVMRRESFRHPIKHAKDSRSNKKKKFGVDSDSCCSEESDDFSERSVLGRGGEEIEKIKRRIRNLDDIAKELDASVEQYTTMRSRHEGERSMITENWSDENHGYDDFCRSLLRQNNDDVSLVKNSSPIKRDTSLHEHQRRPVMLGSGPSNNHENPDVNRTTSIENRRDNSQPPVISQPLAFEPTVVPTRLQAVSTFSDRLHNRIAVLGARPEITSEETSEVVQPSITQVRGEEIEQQSRINPVTQENLLFQGVDPIMAEYMKVVMQKRSVNTQPTPTVSAEAVEVTAADEVQLESSAFDVVDDDIEW